MAIIKNNQTCAEALQYDNIQSGRYKRNSHFRKMPQDHARLDDASIRKSRRNVQSEDIHSRPSRQTSYKSVAQLQTKIVLKLKEGDRLNCKIMDGIQEPEDIMHHAPNIKYFAFLKDHKQQI